MNSIDNHVATTPKRYSPFWAVSLVFLTLIVLQCCFLWDDYSVRSDLLRTQANLTDALTKAQQISQITEAVSRDIYVMSNDSEEARKIVTEFNIRYAIPTPLDE